MDEYCVDTGYISLNKSGELLCGDHIEETTDEFSPSTIVLADGMGSGVKACILSTLTSKILSTMISNAMPTQECIETVASTLPICKTLGVAYSTFTVIRITERRTAEIIQYDNPKVIMIREGKSCDYPVITETVAGKQILKSKIELKENDLFVAMSDGAVHAGVGGKLNFGWSREDIISFLESVYDSSFTAKTLSTILAEQCSELYGGEPGDDTTICSIKIRKRRQVNLLIGPPEKPSDVDKMMSLFFSKEGKRIVCGGTTSTLAADYLNKPLISALPLYVDPEIPPTAAIEGVDLVTEGVITISRVVEYARDYISENRRYAQWSYGKDGASLVARMLFEEATDINFFVGKAMNPAHQNPKLPEGFNIKTRLISELSVCLEKMGKKTKVSYF
ncbi:MAG: SpoIIE family protein phosphatase [Eubacteriales bacterium]|nr:SpoIIE family protein phosphatase [Eubacteriales bacterium]MDD4475261.1 SpoIIE family protein phosphatase [Eubacteriales bacterium]